MDRNHTIAKKLVFFSFNVPLFAKIPNHTFCTNVDAESCNTFRVSCAVTVSLSVLCVPAFILVRFACLHVRHLVTF
jgi:hypothetical protein